MITDGSVVIHGNPQIGKAIADGIAQGKAHRAKPEQTRPTALATPTKCPPTTPDALRRQLVSNAASTRRMDEVRRRYPLSPATRIESIWGCCVVLWWVAAGWRKKGAP